MPNKREGSLLDFEWDENKRQAVLEDRRIDFRDAVSASGGNAVGCRWYRGWQGDRRGLHGKGRPSQNHHRKAGTNT